VSIMAIPASRPGDSSKELPPEPANKASASQRFAGAMNSALERPMTPGMAPRTNGIIDYAVAFILFLAPWILSYSDHAVAPVSRALGALLLFYSLCTKYPVGLLRFIPMQVHLFLDLGMAVLLVAAPIHFAIWGAPGLMMVGLGLLMGIAALLTRHGQKFTRPSAVSTRPPTLP
jgi:hypothetical protein